MVKNADSIPESIEIFVNMVPIVSLVGTLGPTE